MDMLMWWKFWTKKIEETVEQLEDQGDWSLRANGSTYLDRSDESEVLTNRLANSSASVTGIAGQRGAGKSSLALKVLNNCSNRGAFTQLIHSPTGYEPREFLVSIFQRICEEVIARIDLKFGQADSLSERGEAEYRRLSGIRVALILGISIILIGSIGYTAYRYNELTSQARITELETERQQLTKNENEIRDQLDKLIAKPDLTERERARLEQLTDELKYIENRHERLDAYSLNGKEVIYESLILTTPLLIVGYIISLLLGRYLSGIGRQMHHAKTFPRETGLRRLALDLSEHLKFQTTLSNSTETSLSLLKATSKFSTGKTLAARPLSLPGLTAEFARFLERIGEVYSQHVVICLDELDKIENPEDLDELLRGIKGVLGQPNTHFLLTVSEDALARFTTRRRMDRGMLESAFEDIVFLERIDPKFADYMVNLMYPESDRNDREREVHISTRLLWLFGSAIPREIKRSALICLEAGLRPKISAPIVVWESLFRSRMSAMNSWASRVGGDNRITYLFLCCLQESITLLHLKSNQNEQNRYDLDWGRKFIGLWVEHFADLLSPEGNANTEKELDGQLGSLEFGKTDEIQLAFGRAVIEILIGVSGVVYVLDNEPRQFSDILTRQLNTIFEFTPSNLAFAGQLMKAYLNEIGLLCDITNTI